MTNVIQKKMYDTAAMHNTTPQRVQQLAHDSIAVKDTASAFADVVTLPELYRQVMMLDGDWPPEPFR
jgi:hypothetical protein